MIQNMQNSKGKIIKSLTKDTVPVYLKLTEPWCTYRSDKGILLQKESFQCVMLGVFSTNLLKKL